LIALLAVSAALSAAVLTTGRDHASATGFACPLTAAQASRALRHNMVLAERDTYECAFADSDGTPVTGTAWFNHALTIIFAPPDPKHGAAYAFAAFKRSPGCAKFVREPRVSAHAFAWTCPDLGAADQAVAELIFDGRHGASVITIHDDLTRIPWSPATQVAALIRVHTLGGSW
jgi:hypothetical protein